MTESERWQHMLDLQGSDEEKVRWLACHVGRLYGLVNKLRADVASLKASRTKAAKKGKVKR